MILSKKKAVETPRKRKADTEEKENIPPEDVAQFKREEYLKEKAKNVSMPTAEKATIVPRHFYSEAGPLIINVCRDCRNFNAARAMEIIDQDHQQIPFALCQVCRAAANDLRTSRFFHFDLPFIKRKYGL